MGETTTLSVHRCRFVDFNPSSITALAFPPLPFPSIKGKRKAFTAERVPKFGPLIVGHANGNIEVYEWTGSTDTVEAPQAWVVRKVRVQSSTSCGVALMQIFRRHSRGCTHPKLTPSHSSSSIRMIFMKMIFPHSPTFACSLVVEVAN
jgi:hypothetical protein